MTPEIEKEIQARVDFKMNELLTVLKNRANIERNLSFKGHPKYAYRMEAFEEAAAALIKERDMGTPTDDMWKEKADKARNKSVDKIMNVLTPLIQGRIRSNQQHSLVSAIVAAIEDAQRL